jgi:hypothetical protein
MSKTLATRDHTVITKTDALITLREQIAGLKEKEKELGEELLPIAIARGGLLEGSYGTLKVIESDKSTYDPDTFKKEFPSIFRRIATITSGAVKAAVESKLLSKEEADKHRIEKKIKYLKVI